MTGTSQPYRILFVCTANICRSPAAESVARYRYGETAAVFRSAGFLEHGRVCPDPLLQALAEQGVDASYHRSYLIDEASLAAADLVLTMEGEHVRKATLLRSSAFEKIVPLKEAAQEVRRLGPGPLAVEDVLEAVGANRDASSYLTTGWDVADPYRRKLKDYRRAVAEITELVSTVVEPLLYR